MDQVQKSHPYRPLKVYLWSDQVQILHLFWLLKAGQKGHAFVRHRSTRQISALRREGSRPYKMEQAGE